MSESTDHRSTVASDAPCAASDTTGHAVDTYWNTFVTCPFDPPQRVPTRAGLEGVLNCLNGYMFDELVRFAHVRPCCGSDSTQHVVRSNTRSHRRTPCTREASTVVDCCD